jgi:hypothetical protein
MLHIKWRKIRILPPPKEYLFSSPDTEKAILVSKKQPNAKVLKRKTVKLRVRTSMVGSAEITKQGKTTQEPHEKRTRKTALADSQIFWFQTVQFLMILRVFTRILPTFYGYLSVKSTDVRLL